MTHMAHNYYYPSQFTTPPYLSLLILAIYILAFLRHFRVFISHCWRGNVDTTSVINFLFYGAWTYVVAKGIWDVAWLRRDLDVCLRPPLRKMMEMAWVHDDE